MGYLGFQLEYGNSPWDISIEKGRGQTQSYDKSQNPLGNFYEYSNWKVKVQLEFNTLKKCKIPMEVKLLHSKTN